MRGSLIAILIAVAVVFALAVFVDNRIAAGAGALLLIGGIIFNTFRAKRTTPAQEARSERGARELHEEIVRDEEQRGTR
ncbi:hypothetical protein [Aurantiacibacter hainanensis]|uniref:hypothetical protein n=1 Tax=Aurantiacibacter hainanensis TaxID=3076114 RepID=UPI0030C65D13